jgi:hypothetical protein
VGIGGRGVALCLQLVKPCFSSPGLGRSVRVTTSDGDLGVIPPAQVLVVQVKMVLANRRKAVRKLVPL